MWERRYIICYRKWGKVSLAGDTLRGWDSWSFGVHASLGEMRPVETPARMTNSIDCSYLIGRREKAPSADMTWALMSWRLAIAAAAS